MSPRGSKFSISLASILNGENMRFRPAIFITLILASFCSKWHKKHVIQQLRLCCYDNAKITFIHPVINAQWHAKVGLPFFYTPCTANPSIRLGNRDHMNRLKFILDALAFHLWGCGFDSQRERSQCYSNPVLYSCEKSQSTLCRKSWVFSGRSGFLPQGSWQGGLG